jgi:arginyl-tRNA synthetase
VDVAGPGFVNLFLKPEAVHDALRRLLRQGEQGSVRRDEKSLQIEFVSSNPTGPLTVGHGRQAVLGDVLASLYEALGYRVAREYYFNDEGRQVDLLAESLWVRYRQALGDSLEIPEGGYQGDYLVEMARDLKEGFGSEFVSFDAATAQRFKDEAITRISAGIKEDLEALGVRFDRWFSETDLHRSGEVSRALEALRARGGAYERDGAVWLAAEAHGGVKDSVLVRSDGRPTYLLVDIGYHINKHDRGFDQVIDVQGADHQTEQSSMKAAMRILGFPEEFLTYGQHQFVSIREGGGTARMSTRAGRFILLRGLLDEVGRDVVRYFLVARKPESHLEFDIDLARAQSLDNPVYYIQYAYTRIASIFRKAEIREDDWAAVDLSSLSAREELDLIKELDRLEEVVEEAAHAFAPHLLAEYALGLARSFHGYYDGHRVLGEARPLMVARLALLQGVERALRQSLAILGLKAPEAM